MEQDIQYVPNNQLPFNNCIISESDDDLNDINEPLPSDRNCLITDSDSESELELDKTQTEISENNNFAID